MESAPSPKNLGFLTGKEKCLVGVYIIAAVTSTLLFAATLILLVQMENDTNAVGQGMNVSSGSTATNTANNNDQLEDLVNNLSFKLVNNEKQLNDLATELEALKNREITETKLSRELLVLAGAYLASNGLLYKRFTDTVDFSEAQQRCEKIGYRLASTGIRNETVRGELWVHVLKSERSNTWIGLHEPDNDGAWIWSDGWEYNADETPWGRVQPNNRGSNEDCARIWKDDADGIYLGDIGCDEAYAYLCEKDI